MDGNTRTTACYACKGKTFTVLEAPSIITGEPTLNLTCIGCGQGFLYHVK